MSGLRVVIYYTRCRPRSVRAYRANQRRPAQASAGQRPPVRSGSVRVFNPRLADRNKVFKPWRAQLRAVADAAADADAVVVERGRRRNQEMICKRCALPCTRRAKRARWNPWNRRLSSLLSFIIILEIRIDICLIKI